MKTSYKFNMVEIALAIAIIAVGLSAVLVLFPVGINATRAAMDENSSSDAAEYVANFVRGQFLSQWKRDYEGWRGNNPLTKDMEFSVPSGFAAGSKPNDPSENAEISDVSGYSALKQWGTTGTYRFSRVTPEGEETFAALVKIWTNPDDIAQDPDNDNPAACPIYVPDSANNFTLKKLKLGTTKGELELPYNKKNGLEVKVEQKDLAKSVMVEISWPYNAAEEDRTVRTFRVDVYNPYYTIQP